MKRIITILALLSGCLASQADSPRLTRLHSFGAAGVSGATPYAELIEGADGVLYGTTSAGGASGRGTVFRLNKDGSGYTVIKSFSGGANDGASPFGAVIQGSDGALYGTTSLGGVSNCGTIFQLATNGGSFNLLASFTQTNGANPESRLLETGDGRLYGTAEGGGSNDSGVVFGINKDGSGLSVFTLFDGTNASNPQAGLIQSDNGLLYGVTDSGGVSNVGTIFSLATNGNSFGVITSFRANSTNTSWPGGRLVQGTNDMLYGAASGTNQGAIYTLGTDGTSFRLLWNFGTSATNNGLVPYGGLLLGSDGLLYGTTYGGGNYTNGTIFRIGQDGTGFQTLVHLQLPKGPVVSLLEGSDGALYGTTEYGGTANAGTVFTLQKDGSGFAVLVNFSASGGDGRSAGAGVRLASDGGLYGQTRLGGASDAGEIFSVQTDGQNYRMLTNLWSNPGAAKAPVTPLFEGLDGALYGTSQSCDSSNSGAIFKLQKDGSGFAQLIVLPGYLVRASPLPGIIFGKNGSLYGTSAGDYDNISSSIFRMPAAVGTRTALRSFGSAPDASKPLAALLETTNGMLYGTAWFGGASNNGAVFSIGTNGTGYAVLKSFGNPTNEGICPSTPMLLGSDGWLYGATAGGGSTNNAGTVYRIQTNGSGFQTLRVFTGQSGDGRYPSGNLIEAADGTLYGTTERGGTSNAGTIFQLNKDGSGYAVAANLADLGGTRPQGGLSMDGVGNLYGTTEAGGDMGLGTVYRFGSAVEEFLGVQATSGLTVLNCVGLPGTNYWIDRSTDLSSPSNWAPLGTTNAQPSGQFIFTDPSPPANAAYYRMRR